MPFHTVTQPAFALADLFWQAVDYFTVYWFQLALVVATVGYLVTRIGVAVWSWIARRAEQQAMRDEVRNLIAEFEREDRAKLNAVVSITETVHEGRRALVFSPRAGGKDAA